VGLDIISYNFPGYVRKTTRHSVRIINVPIEMWIWLAFKYNSDESPLESPCFASLNICYIWKRLSRRNKRRRQTVTAVFTCDVRRSSYMMMKGRGKNSLWIMMPYAQLYNYVLLVFLIKPSETLQFTWLEVNWCCHAAWRDGFLCSKIKVKNQQDTQYT
jgi:hypothetical protein